GAERTQQGEVAHGAQRYAAGDRRQHGRDEVGTREAERRERRVRAQRVELAMGEVHDVHEPEDECEADAQQGVGPAAHQAVHQVLRERVYQGDATLPSLIWTRKMLGFDWPLSLPAGPAFPNLSGALAPPMLSFPRASPLAPRCSCACFITSVICSTAVVRKSVSPPVPLIFASWAFMSVAA